MHVYAVCVKRKHRGAHRPLIRRITLVAILALDRSQLGRAVRSHVGMPAATANA